MKVAHAVGLGPGIRNRQEVGLVCRVWSRCEVVAVGLASHANQLVRVFTRVEGDHNLE